MNAAVIVAVALVALLVLRGRKAAPAPAAGPAAPAHAATSTSGVPQTSGASVFSPAGPANFAVTTTTGATAGTGGFLSAQAAQIYASQGIGISPAFGTGRPNPPGYVPAPSYPPPKLPGAPTAALVAGSGQTAQAYVANFPGLTLAQAQQRYGGFNSQGNFVKIISLQDTGWLSSVDGSGQILYIITWSIELPQAFSGTDTGVG